MSPDSGDTMLDSGQTSRISGYLAGFRPGSSQNSWITPKIRPEQLDHTEDPAIWPESWTDPATNHLAGPPASGQIRLF
jgi:hypothetical protein